MSRSLVVVDCETSALQPSRREVRGILANTPADIPYGVVTEVAWWNLDTDERGVFVPHHNVQWVRAYGEAKALSISGYLDRLVDAEQDHHGADTKVLHAQLSGNTMAGSNPSFDTRFLGPLFQSVPDLGGDPEPWHHRLFDLAAYAAGVMGVDPREMTGLAGICERLEVATPDHTAAGDVQATGECIKALMDRHALATTLSSP